MYRRAVCTYRTQARHAHQAILMAPTSWVSPAPTCLAFFRCIGVLLSSTSCSPRERKYGGRDHRLPVHGPRSPWAWISGCAWHPSVVESKYSVTTTDLFFWTALTQNLSAGCSQLEMSLSAAVVWTTSDTQAGKLKHSPPRPPPSSTLFSPRVLLDTRPSSTESDSCGWVPRRQRRHHLLGRRRHTTARRRAGRPRLIDPAFQPPQPLGAGPRAPPRLALAKPNLNHTTPPTAHTPRRRYVMELGIFF